ncbi:MAG: arsenate reductase ArsC [Bradyrhizobium sp.]|nr:arsenate reductase ArsC [Bradyrhizobium sp.]
MAEQPVFNVLFLCTGNSARSIIAEAILRKDGKGRFNAYSAGSRPRGAVHPLTVAVLTNMNYPMAGLRSKSWDEFTVPGSPRFDFVFTVCDSAAGEVCPAWPGSPVTAHWGIDDPAAVEGGDFEKATAFGEAFRFLKNRIAGFVSLPLSSLDVMSLKNQLTQLNQLEGTSTSRKEIA